MTAASRTMKVERTGKCPVIEISSKYKRIRQRPRDRSPLLCPGLAERRPAPERVRSRTGEKAQTSRERLRSESVKCSEMGASRASFSYWREGSFRLPSFFSLLFPSVVEHHITIWIIEFFATYVINRARFLHLLGNDSGTLPASSGSRHKFR